MIAAARPDGKSTAVVREQLAEWLDADMDFTSFDGGQGDVTGWCRSLGNFGLGGADSLGALDHVSFDSFSGFGVVLRCIGAREA